MAIIITLAYTNCYRKIIIKERKILIDYKDAWIELQKMKLTQKIELLTKRQIIALNMAINGLEQLTPQPVKTEFATQGGCITCFETAVCPKCNTPLDDVSEFCDFSYCPHCGKALSWESEEN